MGLLSILLRLGFCSSPATPQTGAQPGGSGTGGVIRFPRDPWTKMKPVGRQVGVNDNPHYVVRMISKGERRELLFAVKQGFTGELFGKEAHDFPVKNPDYDYYSDERYAVSLDGGFQVRKATPEEWDATEKPLHSYHFIRTFKNPLVTVEGVKYNEQLYRKTGESWGTEAAILSPRGTWIAVFSYTSREKPPKPLIPGFGGTEPGHGEVFLDIYKTSSGEKIDAARHTYGGDGSGGGYAPSMLFGGSLWVDDSYFVMPLEPSLETCYFGILEEK
jgi:hypothetical protein